MWHMSPHLHNVTPCSFSTFLSISMATHVTVHVTRWLNCMITVVIMQSASVMKKSFPICSKMLAWYLKEVTQSFLGLCWNVLWCFIRSFWECHVGCSKWLQKSQGTQIYQANLRMFSIFSMCPCTCNSGHMHRLTVHVTAYLCGMFCSRLLCI